MYFEVYLRLSTNNAAALFMVILFHPIACSLSCQNGGTLSRNSCTCSCADGYSGSSCESELRIYKLLGLLLLIHTSDMYLGIETPGFVYTVVPNINSD